MTEQPKDSCPACLCGESTPFAIHEGMALVRCGDCGVIHMDRLPSPTQLASLYDDAYDGATTGYFAKVDSKMRRSLHRVRQLRRRVSGGRFLDIGCSGGFMVEAARLQGFGAHGVEVDPKSVAYAREHYPANAYFHGTVQAFAESHGGEPLFDAVYCSEVIEHVPESRSFVAAIAGLMRPGAVLYITTPDISHWRRPKELTNWDAFCPPSHCVFFNPANLTRLLAAHDLVVFKRFISLKPGVKLLARKS